MVFLDQSLWLRPTCNDPEALHWLIWTVPSCPASHRGTPQSLRLQKRRRVCDLRRTCRQGVAFEEVKDPSCDDSGLMTDRKWHDETHSLDRSRFYQLDCDILQWCLLIPVLYWVSVGEWWYGKDAGILFTWKTTKSKPPPQKCLAFNRKWKWWHKTENGRKPR